MLWCLSVTRKLPSLWEHKVHDLKYINVNAFYYSLNLFKFKLQFKTVIKAVTLSHSHQYGFLSPGIVRLLYKPMLGTNYPAPPQPGERQMSACTLTQAGAM